MQNTIWHSPTIDIRKWAGRQGASRAGAVRLAPSTDLRRHWLKKSPLLLISLILHAAVLLGVFLFVRSIPHGNGLSGSGQGDLFFATWIPGDGGGNGGGKQRLSDTVVPDDDSDGSRDVNHSVEVQPAKQEGPLLDVVQTDPKSVFDAESADAVSSLKEVIAAAAAQRHAASKAVGTESDRDRQTGPNSTAGANSIAGLNHDGGKPGFGPGDDGGEGGSSNGTGRGIRFFGIKADAKRVVYVIDASESMRKNNAMELARQNLWTSLQELSLTSKFQIVFFNLTTHLMSVPNERSGLLPATSQNLRLAKQFLTGIQPDSGTDRLAAISQALKFEPDVIFLLTDADEPKMTGKDLFEIQRANKRRAAIHVVEFGIGGDLTRESFLKRLARENHGMHWYYDLARSSQ